MVVCCLGLGSLLAQTTVTLRPTGDGSVKQWNNNSGTACTGTACYSQVNETSGSTNCTSSTHVPGNGVVNKSPATNSRAEQYTMTLSSLPTGAVIDSMTVYSCQARGGSTNTSGKLRIVLNGATTTCSSNQAANSAFAEVSCAFTGLNTNYVSGTTTLEIGNSTTAAAAISMDSIDVDLTYHVAYASGVAASEHTSPAVAALRNVPTGPAQSQHTSPAVTGTCSGNCGASVNKNGPAAAAFKTDPPCCAVTDSPLSATVHFSANPTTNNTISRGLSVSAHTSPAITAQRAHTSSLAAGFTTDPPCCAVTDSPLSASLHFNVVPTTQRSAGGNVSIGTGLTFNNGVSAAANGSLGRSVAQAFTTDPPCCASVTSPFSASFHVSPAVTGAKHSNQSAGALATEHTSPTCFACVGHFFSSAHWTTLTNVTAFTSHAPSVTASAHVSPADSIQQGLNKTVAQSLHTSPAVTDSSAHFTAITAGFQTVAVPSAAGPGSHSVSASVSFHSAPAAFENAVVSTNVAQGFTTSPAQSGNLNLTKQVSAAFQTVALATAFKRTPGSRFVVVIN